MSHRKSDSDASFNSDIPDGQVQDDSYVSRPGHKQEPIPVVSGKKRKNENGNHGHEQTHAQDHPGENDGDDYNEADSDRLLSQTDREAIDVQNIVGERTRGAKPKQSYKDSGAEDDVHLMGRRAA